MLRLYTYFRSSSAYRVRIALNLKGLAYEAVPVHLLRDGGQQNQPAYRALSPLGTVPALETEGEVITQSLAIIEYLDEIHPLPPLLPASAEDRARVRALAQTIACDIHPVNNLRVLQYLGKHFAAPQEQKDAWLPKLASGEHVKLIVDDYYFPDVQDQCNTSGSVPMNNTGSANFIVRWSFLD